MHHKSYIDITHFIKFKTINKINNMDSSTGYVTHSLNKSKAKAAFSFPR